MRAQVMAIQVVLVNRLALSLGPLTVAVLSEHVFGSSQAVGYSLALTVGAAAIAASGAFLSSRKAFCRYRHEADVA